MLETLLLTALVATPLTLPARIAAARSGDTITLQPGRYGAVFIIGRTFAVPLRVDARAAELSAITIRNVRGLDWRGGRLLGPRLQSFGVSIATSSRVAIAAMTVTGPRIGVSISRSTDISVIGNSFDGVRSDGVNIAMSQRVAILGNACINFKPIRAIYASDGKLLVDGDHADCIQGWSRRGHAPTSDITINDNIAEGEMQGVSFFDPGQGGYDRITIRNNRLNLQYWNGIAVYEGRNTVVTANQVDTVDGARAQNWPHKPIRTWIYVTGKNNRVCGNTVEAFPDGEGTGRC